jgi:SSS family solute:Na+ symporter
METFIQTNFSSLDWGIVIFYLLGSFAVGLVANKYIHRIQDFILAGRTLRGFLAFATMTGTELGLVTVMYAAQEGFQRGLSSLHIGLVEGACIFGIGLSGAIVLPLRRMGVMTIPEFYLRRFGKNVQVTGAIILVLAGVLNMGLFLQAGATFVTYLTGLAGTTTVLGFQVEYLTIVMTSMLALVLIYTILGGMVSVIITDYVQFVVLSLAMGIVTACSIYAVGWNDVFTIVEEKMGPEGINPLAHSEYGLSYLVWMILIGFGGGAVWQTSVMRACAIKNPETIKPLFMTISLSYMVRKSFPAFWGACAFAYFATRPELFEMFNFSSPTESAVPLTAGLPTFLARVIPTGLLGLVAAGMLAAFMSTHDSYLLCWSSVITQDILSPLSNWVRGRDLRDSERIFLSRVFIFLIGLFLLTWGLWFQASTTLWNYMSGTGTIYFAGAFPALFGGIYWKRSSSAGAMAAILLGLFGVTTVLPWQDYAWYPKSMVFNTQVWGLLTFALSAVGFVAFSLLFPDKKEEAQA